MTARRGTRVRVAAPLVALLVTMTAACGPGSHKSSTPVTVFDRAADPAQNIHLSAKHVVLTVKELRAALDSALPQHATLVAALVHQVDTGNDSPVAEIRALAANTEALTNAIAVVYGRDAGRAFAQLWEQHTQFFVNYAQADRSHDHGPKEDAESQLTDYQNDFASFLSTATAGGAGLAGVTALLHTHVEDITGYIDADVAGHTTAADQLLAEAVTHMHKIARAVTDAIAAQHLDTVTS